MPMNTQEKNMRRLSELMGQDLTYIGGPKECGPNGAKKEFLDKGRTFLRAAAKDLGFTESRVTVNPAGIGAPGDVSLYGMWSEGSGVYVMLEPNLCWGDCVLYRTITALNGGKPGDNRFLSLRAFSNGSYSQFLNLVRSMDRGVTGHGRAA